MKVSPVTGEEIPDETARMPVCRYLNPGRAEWPAANFIIGNPPYIGNKRMRLALGDGYVEALRSAHDDVPETADYVMYWWNQAAQLASAGKIRRFGFITTNSITQTFNRKVVERHLTRAEPISIVFGIPDHPWVDPLAGAAVRVALTVATASRCEGTLASVVHEEENAGGERSVALSVRYGIIHSDLTIGSNVAGARKLKANTRVCFQGYILVGKGFCLEEEELESFGLRPLNLPPVIRPWKNGRDLLAVNSNRFVIDLFGLSESDVRLLYPRLYQRLLLKVKPLRDQVARKNHRERWWLWGEARPGLRQATKSLDRVIVTNFAAKHRVFIFEPSSVAIDHNMFVIATSDPFPLGVLSSKIHIGWMLAAGSTLEDRPLWISSTCFDPFPFPVCAEEQKQCIRDLGEALDAHRKRQQALYSKLTITGMYNVLEKLRSGEPLTEKEREIHEQGLVSVLKQIHDDLDAAVFEAYGWPSTLTNEEILERLVALNHERAEEEKLGLVRWLRPDFQNPQGEKTVTQVSIQDAGLETPKPEKVAKVKRAAKLPWPKDLPARVVAVRDLLAELREATAAEVPRRFKGVQEEQAEKLLESLAAVGVAIETTAGEGSARSWSLVR
jgi:hypothetical protein